jgi:hypothetical protein
MGGAMFRRVFVIAWWRSTAFITSGSWVAMSRTWWRSVTRTLGIRASTVVMVVVIAWARLTMMRTMIITDVAGGGFFWFAVKINDVFGYSGTTAAFVIIITHNMAIR